MIPVTNENLMVRSETKGEWRTKEELAQIGRVPKKDAVPVRMYTNGLRWAIKEYYLLRDTQKDTIEDLGAQTPKSYSREAIKKNKAYIQSRQESRKAKAAIYYQKYKEYCHNLSFCYKYMNKLFMDPRKNVVIYDLETTGLEGGLHGIVQIAMIDKYGNVLLSSYVKPDECVSWTRKSQRITGITKETVANAPTIDQLRGRIQRILDNADVLVGFSNMRSDDKFLVAEGFRLPKKNFDVMQAFSEVIGNWNPKFKGYVRQSLRYATKYYDYKWEGKAHDALADAKATLFVARRLCSTEAQVNWPLVRSERRKKRSTKEKKRMAKAQA